MQEASESDSPVRARILKVACELFYRDGIRAVGVDTIVEASGVAKTSLYRWFPSKDHLVAAYLAEIYLPFWEWWEAVVARTPHDPEQQLRNLLNGIVKSLDKPTYRGCPSINAASELADPEHPGRQQCRANKAEMRRRLLALCKDLGAREPRTLANQLTLLIDGAYTNAQLLGSKGAHRELMSAALTLVGASRNA